MPALLIGSIAKHFGQVYGRRFDGLKEILSTKVFGGTLTDDDRGGRVILAETSLHSASEKDEPLNSYINYSLISLTLQLMVILTWIISYQLTIEDFGGRWSVRTIEVDDSGW